MTTKQPLAGRIAAIAIGAHDAYGSENGYLADVTPIRVREDDKGRSGRKAV
ncbi:hypothetical protein [Streptomyces sp. NPDC093111]|uniref:hypothetical protein n=1 Tax=Streptomyces sp. NPDC093111 TaxID=3154978 RepID=UPI00344032DD